MTTYYRGRRRWRRPATDFPDRAHAANVADLVHQARVDSLETDRRFFEDLLRSEQTDSRSEGGARATDQNEADPDPTS